MQLNLQTRAWYLDHLGVERECVAVTVAGRVLVVLDLEGRPVEVDPGSLYYVPKHAEDPPE